MQLPLRYLVVHCSDTRATKDIGVAEIRAMHRQKGWADVGYHYVIRRDGTVEKGRLDTTPGAHVLGHNSRSLGICMVGGGLGAIAPKRDGFTGEQYAALKALLTRLRAEHPTAEILGHRDLSPDLNRDGKITPNEWVKECPTFDVRPWWATVNSAS